MKSHDFTVFRHGLENLEFETNLESREFKNSFKCLREVGEEVRELFNMFNVMTPASHKSTLDLSCRIFQDDAAYNIGNHPKQ